MDFMTNVSAPIALIDVFPCLHPRYIESVVSKHGGNLMTAAQELLEADDESSHWGLDESNRSADEEVTNQRSFIRSSLNADLELALQLQSELVQSSLAADLELALQLSRSDSTPSFSTVPMAEARALPPAKMPTLSERTRYLIERLQRGMQRSRSRSSTSERLLFDDRSSSAVPGAQSPADEAFIVRGRLATVSMDSLPMMDDGAVLAPPQAISQYDARVQRARAANARVPHHALVDSRA